MRRKGSSLGNGFKVDLFVEAFLGAGKFGRVFRCKGFLGNIFLGALVVKVTTRREGSDFDTEETAYSVLRSLYDTTIPHFHGQFSGELNGVNYSALLLSDGGGSVKSLAILSVWERYVFQ